MMAAGWMEVDHGLNPEASGWESHALASHRAIVCQKCICMNHSYIDKIEMILKTINYECYVIINVTITNYIQHVARHNVQALYCCMLSRSNI